MLAFIVYALIDSVNYTWYGGIFMQIVAVVGLLLTLPLMFFMVRAAKPAGVLCDGERTIKVHYSNYHYLGWIIGMFALVGLVGFPFGCALFIYSFMQSKVGNAPVKHAVMGVSAVGFLGLISHFLTLRYPAGLLQYFLDMPWWLGG